MNPENPHEELEMRITALLLGELSDDEASALRQAIAEDAELARLHDRLKFAIELARQTSVSPSEEEMAKPEELKLAPERRAKLLAVFTAPKILKLTQQRRTRRRELLALAAMFVGLLAVAGVLMMWRDESRRDRTVSLYNLSPASPFAIFERGREKASATINAGLPHAREEYLERAQAQAKDAPNGRVQISGQVELPRANRPTPSSSVATRRPSREMPATAEPKADPSHISDLSVKSPESAVPGLQDREGKDAKSFVVREGRIALPAPEAAPRAGDQISRESAATDFFAESKFHSANEFAWSAPVPGSGGGGGVGGGMKPTASSGVPQLGERFDQSGQQNLQLLTQNTLADDVRLLTPLPAQAEPAISYDAWPLMERDLKQLEEYQREKLSREGLEQPPAPVDPATGLPFVALTPAPPVTPPPTIDRETRAGEFVNGTHVAGTLSYGGATATKGLFLRTNQMEAFQKRLGNIVNRAANPAIDDLAANLPPKGDFDADGTARGWRFKADESGRAANQEQKLEEKKKASLDVNRSAVVGDPEYVGIAQQLSPTTQGAQEARRAQIALPSPARGDAEKQVVAGSAVVVNEIAANPVPKSLERLADVQDRPTSDNAVLLGRDLDNLRQGRDRLAARITRETVDTSIPRSGAVEIVDPAEAKPAKSPTVLERIGGAFRSGVERRARLRVEKDAPDVAGIAEPSASFDPYWVQTETERIQSKSVMSNVAQKLNLNEAWGEKRGGERLKSEDTLALLKKRTTVSTDPKSGLIDIKVKSDNAEEAARIANTIAEVYRDQRLSERQQLAGRGVETLEKELAKQEQKIAQVEQDLEHREKEKAAKDVGGPKPATTAGIPQPEVFTADNPFSTFSLNVSDVSFKLAAASLEKGALPEPATVRTEEFINAFDYRDPEPMGSAPIAFAWERARYPFAHDRDLVRFSVKTAASGRQPGRPLNLVLLLDNSGSMERADRLRIRQECLRVLASQLQTNDRVSVVAFARTAQLWVDGLPGAQGGELPERVGSLAPQGGTNLEEAMNLAYRTALRHFLADGVNRVVLLTDGAANLGDVEPESLKKKVEANRQQGIALDCFGIGWEGYNDDLLEVLSRNGDGRYGFVNTPEAASSEFAGQLAGALKVAASDVKVQVEFNPRRVTAYRQMGYAKHQLKKEQFRDNTVDAAEIGAAEAGNALYVVQVNPRGEGPLGTVRVRFKVPGTSDYREHEWPVPYDGAAKPLEQSAFPMRLATTAAAFSEWLVSSPYAAEVAPDRLLSYLSGVPESCPADPRPKKLEWMIRQAKSVAGK